MEFKPYCSQLVISIIDVIFPMLYKSIILSGKVIGNVGCFDSKANLFAVFFILPVNELVSSTPFTICLESKV